MSEQFVRTPAGPDSISTLTTLLEDGAVTTRDARAAYSQAILALKALRDAKPAYWVHEVEGMDPMLWKEEPFTNVGRVRKLFYAPQEPAVALPGDTGPFTDWLAQEMPGGTVILDPRWWASRILRKIASLITSPIPGAPDVDAMVNRFLAWRLPDDFAPDSGISFSNITDPVWTHDTWPTGTNLLNAAQARAMFEHCMTGAPSESQDGTDPDAAAKAFAESVGEQWNKMGAEARQRAREWAAFWVPREVWNQFSPAAGEESALGCADCGLLYGSTAWGDFVVPDDVWKQISPTGDEGGILCVTCMIRRAAARGIECEGSFTSGPFANSNWRKPADSSKAGKADLVGQLVVGWTSDGEDKFVAEARGYCDAPTFIFSREPYTTWRADMVRPATPEEAATYWRERAMNAEGREAHTRG